MNKVVANAALSFAATVVLGLNLPLSAQAATTKTLSETTYSIGSEQVKTSQNANELNIPQTQKIAGYYQCTYGWYTWNGGYTWHYGCY